MDVETITKSYVLLCFQNTYFVQSGNEGLECIVNLHLSKGQLFQSGK